MGNRASFEGNFKFEGQSPDVFITFDHLGLRNPEIDKFWRAFCRIDANKDGKITPQGNRHDMTRIES
jgi:hypothetical protein